MNYNEYKTKAFAKNPEVKAEYDALAPSTRSSGLKFKAAKPPASPRKT